MKKLIVWMAALALLAIGGQAYAEEGSQQTAGNQETLMPAANPADKESAQQMVENKNTAYEQAQRQKPPTIVSGGGIMIGGQLITIPNGVVVSLDGKPVGVMRNGELDPFLPKPPSRTDPNFDPDANPLS